MLKTKAVSTFTIYFSSISAIFELSSFNFSRKKGFRWIFLKSKQPNLKSKCSLLVRLVRQVSIVVREPKQETQKLNGNSGFESLFECNFDEKRNKYVHLRAHFIQ